MSSNELLALVGGIIVAGFLANFIFKAYKIPSVVLLMGIGLLLGPVFKVLPGQQLMEVAPIFGNIALLIILFSGGLGLKIETVVSQLRSSVLLAVLGFGGTFALAVPLCIVFMKMDTINAIILATLVAGTASSIVIPVVTKLSVSDNLKTLLSIESALSNLLILVVVIIACDIYITTDTSFIGVVGMFFYKIFISLISALIAGFIWARLIASLKEDALSYMLTLGFIFLLNFVVDKIEGNGAISILFFGIVLANVSTMLDLGGPQIKKWLGLRVDSTKYILNEFLKGISGELSFLVGTFFFTFLGLLVSFDDLNWEIVRNIILLIITLVAGRLLILPLFRKMCNNTYNYAQLIIIMSMMPRGLATAVMAFKPAEAPYFIEGTDKFPLYAMFIILGSNLIMTGLVKFGEIKLSKLRKSPAISDSPIAIDSLVKEESIPEISAPEIIADEPGLQDLDYSFTPPTPEIEEELPQFTERLQQVLKIRASQFIDFEKQSIRSIKVRDLFYWLRLVLMAVVTILGLMMDRSEIVLAALLLSPLTFLTNTLSFGIVSGDVYVFLKAIFKLMVSALAVLVLCTIISGATPFIGITDTIISRIHPTVLDFLLALTGGFALPFVLLRGNRIEVLGITPIIGLLVIPPLAVVAYALGHNNQPFFSEVFWGGLLSAAGNFAGIVLGAAGGQLMLGFSTYKASPSFHEWQENEIEHGILHTWFERLHLVRVLGTMGTFGGRLVALLVLGIAVFIPMQMTFNEIRQEYQIDQAITELGQEFFEITDKSALLNSSFEKKGNLVVVKMRISTQENFPPDRLAEFESRVEAATGVPTRLELTQLHSDFSTEDTPGQIPLGLGSRVKSFSEKMELIGPDLEYSLNALPELTEVKIISIKPEYRPTDILPGITIEYYCPTGDLNQDIRMLIAESVSRNLNLNTENINFRRIPHQYFADLSHPHEFRDKTGYFGLIDVLEYTSGVQGVILLPIGVKRDSARKLVTSVRSLHPQLADTLKFPVSKTAQVSAQTDKVFIQINLK